MRSRAGVPPTKSSTKFDSFWTDLKEANNEPNYVRIRMDLDPFSVARRYHSGSLVGGTSPDPPGIGQGTVRSRMWRDGDDVRVGRGHSLLAHRRGQSAG